MSFNSSLCNNQLTGSIPVSIGNMIGLKSFAVNNNQLTDTIPRSIINSRSL